MKLVNEERKQLEELFTMWERRGLSYVVLRKYKQLPKRVDGDVDVFVSPEDYERAVELGRRVGFKRQQTGKNRVSLLWYGLRNPNRVLSRIFDNINQLVLSETETAESKAEPASMISRQTLEYSNVEIDLYDHVPYLSDGPSVWFRVTPDVEAKMLRRRRSYRGFSVPAVPDELMHIVLHCAFDYDGEVPPYYGRRYETLAEKVFEEPRMREQFEQLATDLFTEDAERAVRFTEQNAFDELVQLNTLSERRLAWQHT